MASALPEVVITHAVRTPVGRYGGGLKDFDPQRLATFIMKSIVDRSGVELAIIDQVIFGWGNQAGRPLNLARVSLLEAGLPIGATAFTLHMNCASGLEAAALAANAIKLGEAEVCIAGGVEAMTHWPYVIEKPGRPYQPVAPAMYGPDGLYGAPPAVYGSLSMGDTAENVAEKYEISRERQDQFALASHRKAAAAWEKGFFAKEVVPVPVGPKGELMLRDEGPRPDTTIEKLASLPPAFRKNGTVTAGNSCPMNDGAAALVLMSLARAEKLGIKPLVTIAGNATAGVDPRIMGIGPVPATRRLLNRLGLNLSSVDLIELNEAFAAQSLAVIDDLGLDPEIVNINGGAIALGHPIGCSGARLIATLAHTLQRTGQRRGIVTMCVGGGQGAALMLERSDY